MLLKLHTCYTLFLVCLFYNLHSAASLPQYNPNKPICLVVLFLLDFSFIIIYQLLTHMKQEYNLCVVSLPV